jgi:Cu-Zn family superoxide dismutase
MSFARAVVAMLAALLVLAACSGTASLDPRRWFGREEATKAAPPDMPGVEARLRGIGSATTGVIRVRESGELFVVQVNVNDLRPGGTYRVVFHESGNCTSPNAFSAGAQWSPPGARDPATRLIPLVHANSEGMVLMTARLRGVRMGDGGMLNRGVLVYEGTSAETPKPGVPNNVVACGAFVKSTTLF